MIAHTAALTLLLSAPGQPTAADADPTGLNPTQPITAIDPRPFADPTAEPYPFDIKLKTVPIGPDREDRYILTQTLAASPDSGSVTYRHRFGNDLALDGYAHNGRNVLTALHFTDPVFGPDSQDVAVVIMEKGWKLYYQRDWTDGYEPVSPVRFSPDGERLFYMARDDMGDEKQRFVVDGGYAHPPADHVDWDNLVVTADSAVIAYPAFMDGAWRMVVNGDPGPAWNRIGSAPITTPNSRAVFYIAVRNGRHHVADRHTAGPGLRLIDTAPAASDDGRTFAYWGLGDDLTWRVYRNHEPVPGYETDRPGQLIVSPDGKTLVAALKRGEHWVVLRDGEPSDAYAAVGRGSLTFSPDGKRLAYAVRRPQGWAVILDGVEKPTFSQLAANGLRFSPDSKRFVYVVLREGRWAVIEGNDAHPDFNQIDTTSIAFSADSKRLAYLGTLAGWPTLVLDGEVLGEYDRVLHPTFSPNGEHLVYVARTGDRLRLFVDGLPTGETFDELVHGAKIHFKRDTVCQTVALRRPGPTLWRFELDLTPADQDGTPAPDLPEEPLPEPSFVDVPTE